MSFCIEVQVRGQGFQISNVVALTELFENIFAVKDGWHSQH